MLSGSHCILNACLLNNVKQIVKLSKRRHSFGKEVVNANRWTRQTNYASFPKEITINSSKLIL